MFDALAPSTQKTIGNALVVSGVGLSLYHAVRREPAVSYGAFTLVATGIAIHALARWPSDSSTKVGQSQVSKELDPAFKDSSVKYLPWMVGGLLAGTAALLYARAT